jgi:hypothetical protein
VVVIEKGGTVNEGGVVEPTGITISGRVTELKKKLGAVFAQEGNIAFSVFRGMAETVLSRDMLNEISTGDIMILGETDA